MTRVVKRSALQRLKETYKSDDLILPSLYRHVMRDVNDDFERSADRMHPSEMAKQTWCWRHDYYRIKGYPANKSNNANPSFTMENIFTEGHDIHHKYQRWFRQMGILYGLWFCQQCSNQWFDTSPPMCPQCWSNLVVYREVPLLHNELMIEGHGDGALHGLDGPIPNVMIEIKSIGIRTLAFEAPRLYQRYLNGDPAEDIWFSIQRPFGSHLRQGMLYLYLAQPVYQHIVFIYESKFNQRVKEFVVKYNPAAISGVLENAKDTAQGVRAGIEPDRPLWAAPDGKICTSCPYRGPCWNQESTNGQDHPTQQQPIPVLRAKAAVRRRSLRQAGLRPA